MAEYETHIHFIKEALDNIEASADSGGNGVNRPTSSPVALKALPPPKSLRDRPTALQYRAETLEKQRQEALRRLHELEAFLALQPGAAQRLEQLATAYFGDILQEAENNLSFALQEILGQNLRVVTSREVKYGKVHIQFGIERDGRPEDILRGQGGSVCNVLSVGLRSLLCRNWTKKRIGAFSCWTSRTAG
ncbi:MAG: hypothetical protein ACUVSA_14275 [Desulfosoma sp.]|uniref:hypothetical protein n=1 Tax=Desulfosoma sp. TaxID=2603217 RepID=UPI00404AF41A